MKGIVPTRNCADNEITADFLDFIETSFENRFQKRKAILVFT